MKKYATVLAILFILTSCATGELMSRLRPGMPKQEVIQTLGNPDGYQARGEYEALKYSHRLVTGWAWDRADYFVILKDGKQLSTVPERSALRIIATFCSWFPSAEVPDLYSTVADSQGFSLFIRHS